MRATPWKQIRSNSSGWRREQSGAGDGKPSPAFIFGLKNSGVSAKPSRDVARDEREKVLAAAQLGATTLFRLPRLDELC